MDRWSSKFTSQGCLFSRFLARRSRISFRAGEGELQDHRILHRARHHRHARQPPSRFARGLRPLFAACSLHIRLQYNISRKNHSFVIIKEISCLVRDIEIWKRKKTMHMISNDFKNKERASKRALQKSGVAEKILRHIAKRSVKFQKSVASHAKQKNVAIGVVARKIVEVDTSLAKVASQRESIDKRLSFLLEGDNLEMAQSFRDEYGKQFVSLRDKERELDSTKRELQLLHKHLLEARPSRKAGGLELVSEAISHIKKDDLTSLKSVYRRMFEKIVIRPLEGKKVQLEFIFKDMTTLTSPPHTPPLRIRKLFVGAGKAHPAAPCLMLKHSREMVCSFARLFAAC